MCLQCAHPELTYADYLDLVILPLVRQRGWAVQGVGGRRPFAYTVGLTECGLSELIVTGLRQVAAASLLNAAVLLALQDEPETGRALDVGSRRVHVVRVDRPEDHLLTATALYGDAVRALQLVWPDERGLYPWQLGHRSVRRGQPLLGRRPLEP